VIVTVTIIIIPAAATSYYNRYTLINCRKQFPNTSHRLLKDILCHCLRERAITGSLWDGVHALLVTLQQPELCVPLLHAMQPQDLVSLTQHSDFDKVMKPRLLQVLSPRETTSNIFAPSSHCVPPSQWRDSLPLAMQQLLDGTPLTEAGAAVVGVQSSAQEQPGNAAETGAAAAGEAEVTDMAP